MRKFLPDSYNISIKNLLPVVFAVCLLLFVTILTSSGCSDNSGQIINLFLSDLVTRTDNAVAGSISRLQMTEKQIDDVRVQRNALEQVAAPAREWLALQKENAIKNSWSRKTLQVIDDLPKLRNDKYEVVKLGFSMELMGTYETVIDIKDLATGNVNSYDKTRQAIDEQEYLLVQEGNMITSSIDKASGAISNVMDRAGEITVTRLNENSYKILGPLGLDGSGNPVQSQWQYNLDLQKAEPSDQPAITLQKTLECR